MNKIEEIVKSSAARHENSRKEYRVFGTNIFIKDELPENIDFKKVIRQIEFLIPSTLFVGLDVIYIGHFKEFEERDINAFYSDGAIYITNEQTDHNDIIDDLVHELSHAIEETNWEIIYIDKSLEDEFLSKRATLKRILKSQDYNLSGLDLSDPSYSREFDEFLYKELGYEKLTTFVQGLFPSAYSVTSLKEYWATGFEEYYLGDRRYLAHTSPRIYNKIKTLEEKGEHPDG